MLVGMSELNPLHTIKGTPTPTILPVLEKVKGFYKEWMPVHRKIPRTERFGIGMRIDTTLLDLLMALRRAGFASGERKIALLEIAIGKIDDVRFLFQLLWETRLASNEQFILFGKKIEEIGKDVGGWRKGVLAKTPPLKAEEKKVKE